MDTLQDLNTKKNLVKCFMLTQIGIILTTFEYFHVHFKALLLRNFCPKIHTVIDYIDIYSRLYYIPRILEVAMRNIMSLAQVNTDNQLDPFAILHNCLYKRFIFPL